MRFLISFKSTVVFPWYRYLWACYLELNLNLNFYIFIQNVYIPLERYTNITGLNCAVWVTSLNPWGISDRWASRHEIDKRIGQVEIRQDKKSLILW